MGLSRFPTVMNSAADAVLNVGEVLSYIKDSRGDLLFSSLEDLQSKLRVSKETTFRAFAEAEKQAEYAEDYMLKMGGPSTILEYKAKAYSVEQAAAAWNSRLQAFLVGLPNSCLISLITIDRDNISTKHIERPGFIPGEIAQPLRDSSELSDLLQAFKSVGA